MKNDENPLPALFLWLILLLIFSAPKLYEWWVDLSWT
jgi:hypothetical protein